MADRQKLKSGFRLSEWIVRPDDGSLTSPTSTQRLEPLLMELLVFLSSRAGEVVPKQEVLEAVWGGRFVSDETVKGSFYQLRKALGDNPRQPRFIETLPKRGYRILIKPELLEVGGEAHDLTAKGRAALSEQPSAASLKQAKLYFERATQSDPGNAAAWAGLARTCVLMVGLGLGRASEFLARARAAATRANQLDPKLAEAHSTLGVVHVVEDHDFPSAEREFRLATQLHPADALAHRWYARFLSSQGRHDEAIAESRRAIDADPLSLVARRELLDFLFAARRYDEMIAEAYQFCELNPGASDVLLGLVWVYCLQEKDRQAFDVFLAGMRSLGVAPHLLDQARDAFQRGGMPAILRLWIQVLEQQAAVGQKTQLDLLILHALLGDTDRCFQRFDALLEEAHPYLMWLPVLPVFDRLRSDPRYPLLLARLGFAAGA
ncbi:MAG TPA: winged helix-turn-helix domain-containing protein [Bryobacteraceae bacterium]|nr:winged helix-turn-helix domain-containing protein [Bryobacteraceae bacterium]